jgi:S1-C subfamily serine protease
MPVSDVKVRTAVAVTLGALVASLLGGCASTDLNVEERQINVVSDDPTPAGQSISPGLIADASPSFLTLTVSKPKGVRLKAEDEMRQPITSGSGFLVESDGYVMTAAHVAVSPGNSVMARAPDGRIYTGSVIATKPDNDMALIKLRGYHGKAVQVNSDVCLKRGSDVFSLGRPHDLGDTARIGKLELMHFGRPVSYGSFGYPDAMVMHMNTQKGESGGPVFNSSGNLVGMVVSTLADADGRPLNLAHALPLSSLAAFVCANTACSAAWQAVRSKSTDNCPNT